MMVCPSLGSRRSRVSYIGPCAAMFATVPDWCTSKCAGALRTPYRKTPPYLGLGSGARSLKACAANTLGICASGRPSDTPYATATAPTAVLKKARRVSHVGLESWLSIPYPLLLRTGGLLRVRGFAAPMLELPDARCQVPR